MTTRFFSFWCENCPTRITVETEVQAVMPDGEPTYDFAETEWVGQVQTRMPTLADDGYEPARHCPACAHELCDLDSLLAVGSVPYHESEDSPRVHAEWIAKGRVS
jgi:hypothetical protein